MSLYFENLLLVDFSTDDRLYWVAQCLGGTGWVEVGGEKAPTCVKSMGNEVALVRYCGDQGAIAVPMHTDGRWRVRQLRHSTVYKSSTSLEQQIVAMYV